jgi:hypothetical protein
MSLKIIRNLAVMLFLGVGGVYVVNAEAKGVNQSIKVMCTCTASPNCSCSCTAFGAGTQCVCAEHC